MHPDLVRILYSREVIEERVKELAGQVVGVFRERRITVAVVLKGAFVFAADLVRHLPEQVEIVFLRSASYGVSTSPETSPRVDLPADVDWTGRHVLLVEDIVDTGHTVEAIRRTIADRGAATVRICAFLDKPARRRVPVDVEFVGFSLPDEAFVVGYGLDLAERYRNLPYVGIVERRKAGTRAKSGRPAKAGRPAKSQPARKPSKKGPVARSAKRARR
jgi:hypoxanthine phosphoribosyltransferase